MNCKILALAIFVAAVAAGFLVTTLDSGQDIAAEAECNDRPEFRQPPDGWNPGPGHQERHPQMKEPKMLPPPEHGPEPLVGFEPFHNQTGPGPKESKPPEYRHDVSKEDFERLIPQMIYQDLSGYNPDFVIDAIDFAKENGMYLFAHILKIKMASSFESYLRTTYVISHADVRASGLEEDQEDELALIEIVEDDDEEDIPPIQTVPEPFPFEAYYSHAVTSFVLLEL